MSVVKLTVQNFEQEVLKADTAGIGRFYADWCGPCQMMGPVVEEIAGEVSDAKVCKSTLMSKWRSHRDMA